MMCKICNTETEIGILLPNRISGARELYCIECVKVFEKASHEEIKEALSKK